jgi:hypothetical protein
VSGGSSDLSSRLKGSMELEGEMVCVVCGERLNGDEPFWCIGYPRGAHTRCVRWSDRPFPFAGQLTLLRRAWRETRHARARREIARVGAWLATLERRWAVGEGNAAEVEEGRARLASLRRFVGREQVSPKLKELY